MKTRLRSLNSEIDRAEKAVSDLCSFVGIEGREDDEEREYAGALALASGLGAGDGRRAASNGAAYR